MRRRNLKYEGKKQSLLAKTIESLKDNENYETIYNKLNQKLFRKSYKKTFDRNSSLKIYSYNQKKAKNSKKNRKIKEDYSKNIIISN